MKKRQKLYLLLILTGVLIYLVLLHILTVSESLDPSSGIKSFGDAFWYSIVTLTTVGYGDTTPVTPVGHLIGLIFLLLSAGVMVTIFGTVFSALAGEAIPLFFLGLKSDRNWYYFSDYGIEENTLAANIIKEDPEAIIIYGQKRADHISAPDHPCIFLDAPLSKILAKKKKGGSRVKVFLIKEGQLEYNARSGRLQEFPVDVYAQTRSGKDHLPGNIHLFNGNDCCARRYWRKSPLCLSEDTIVIIGFGRYARALTERAILTNVITPEQHIAYHIFGDPTEFLNVHYRLDKLFSINEESNERDSLIFHTEAWNQSHTLLERADRIIICEDDEQLGWDIYWALHHFYRTNGKIDLRSSRTTPGVSCFGTNDEIYTPEQILRTNLNEAAITVNELFRKSVDYPTLSWEELDEFHQQSKIAAADHLLMKSRILLRDESVNLLSRSVLHRAYKRYAATRDREEDLENYRRIEHLRWLRFYVYYNWSYGKKRDDAKKQHPMLRPYAELTLAQRKERDAAWELIDNISVELHD
jgi:hypothetical protein